MVNALRSLYRWAQDRELVAHNPPELVRLPVMDATPRDRVATPAEFAALLARLALETPEYQPGAAAITLRRYTHTLPGELERARDLDRFLAERELERASSG